MKVNHNSKAWFYLALAIASIGLVSLISAVILTYTREEVPQPVMAPATMPQHPAPADAAVKQQSAFLEHQKRVAVSNAMYVASRDYAKFETIVLPLDEGFISESCPLGSGWVKVEMRWVDSPAQIRWCNVTSLTTNDGCRDKEEMKELSTWSDAWFEGKDPTACNTQLRPLIDWYRATDAELEQ